MRIWFWIFGMAFVVAGAGMVYASGKSPRVAAGAPVAQTGSAHDFRMTRIDGRPMPLDQFRGQVMLVVNTASMCGFTPQYEGLQALHQRYGPRGFTVIGVPSGDFGGQEHGDNAKIREFCDTTFGITFPLTEKAHVKGANALPFYRWARESLSTDNEPRWNFHKFLVGRDGRLIAGFGSRVAPDSPELRAAIEKALGA